MTLFIRGGAWTTAQNMNIPGPIQERPNIWDTCDAVMIQLGYLS
jgi:hypothetical protein